MEHVLVVNRKELEALLPPVPFTTENMETIRRFILENHFFMEREKAEYDNTVKQIIPYVVIRQEGKYFLLRRLKKQTEARLHDKLSLGVGGHINPTEETAEDPLEAGLLRELDEEVAVETVTSLAAVGFLNENNGGVSDYHAALVCLLEAQGEVTVRETEKMSGSWAAVQELQEALPYLETWSQIVVEKVILTGVV
ncbi:MAG: NUDIX domain-containing protein [Ruminiclostridium sp.]|nr:NUDIX domain-containing protein [Ruminiclostridium sp.]